MTLEIVALIDDKESDLADWQKYLSQAGIEARAFLEKDDFARCLARGDHFDAIVLDWYLDDNSSLLAQLVLEQIIRPNRFVPVLVYTGESEIARDEIPQLKSPFNQIQVISKYDVDAARLAELLKGWYGTTTARISEVWRNARRVAFEQALYRLSDLEGKNLQATLQHLLVLNGEMQLDIDQALEFLERYVGRDVMSNRELRGAVQAVLEEGRIAPEDARKIEPTLNLVNAHRYVPVDDDEKIVRTGDIVDVCDAQTGEILMAAVIVTPACDLDNRKCRELRLLIAYRDPIGEDTGGTQWWELNAVRRRGTKDFEHYRLNFHRTLCLTDKEMKPDKEKKQLWESVLSYERVYEDSFGKTIRLKPICRLDDPYRADLLQKFSSHAARIGIP